MTGTDAPNSGFYFPWVQAPDALQQNALRAFPPCGFVAGIFARTDASRGVWKAPAGTEASLTGATGLAIPMSDAENGQLNPHAINCLRTLPVYGNVVWGSRTLDGDNDRGSEWKYVPVRRMALFLEESLYRATQWVVFEPNDEPLWAQIRLNIGAFLQGLFRQGAFQGNTPKQAYFVKCDSETNDPGRYQSRHRQHLGWLRAAEASGVCRPQDPADRWRHPDLAPEFIVEANSLRRVASRFNGLETGSAWNSEAQQRNTLYAIASWPASL